MLFLSVKDLILSYLRYLFGLFTSAFGTNIVNPAYIQRLIQNYFLAADIGVLFTALCLVSQNCGYGLSKVSLCLQVHLSFTCVAGQRRRTGETCEQDGRMDGARERASRAGRQAAGRAAGTCSKRLKNRERDFGFGRIDSQKCQFPNGVVLRVMLYNPNSLYI